MTKYDIETYYGAIGKSQNLMVVDTYDRIDDVVKSLNEKINDSILTVNIEIMHNMESIQSYIFVFNENNTCDLYKEKHRILTNRTVMEIASYITCQMPEAATSPYHKYVDRKNSDGTYTVINSDTKTEEIIDDQSIPGDDAFILGIYQFPDGHTEIHPVNHIPDEKIADLLHLTDAIEDEKIRLYAQTCLRLIPDYVATAPSGVDGGKYPADNIAEGGLKRRITHTAEMMALLTSQDYAHIKFSKKEIDMMLTACIFCDAWHNGWQEDYEKDNSVKFEHPRIAANALRCITDIVSPGTVKFITNCIESHMGQKNKPKDGTDGKQLPVPDTEFKYTVHLANYITKQQNICIESNGTWYHYDDATITAIEKKKAIKKDDIILMNNALAEKLNLEQAKEYGITSLSEKDIKNTWRYLLNEKAANDDEQKYIKYARSIFIL